MNSPKPELNVLYLDNHLIAVYKPSGVPIQPDATGELSLMDMTKTWLKAEFNKPGKVFLGLVHRLDRPVAGVVLFARTSKAASRLSEQFREGTPQKIYRVVIEGTPAEPKGELIHYLRKEKTLKATVFPRETSGAKRAELSYRMVKPLAGNSLCEVDLKSGRFHQIRAQFAFIGHPVLGDVKYGASSSLPDGMIALYAHRLVVRHPVSKEEVEIVSPPPPSWPPA